MQISPETWAKMSKSQKRAARKKIAAQRTSAAIQAADRRDADFVAKHTGSLAGKNGEIAMFKLTKEEKQAVAAVAKVEKSIAKNNAWNAAECLTAVLESSRFENDVKTKTYASMRILDASSTQGDKAIALKAGKSSMENIRSNFEDVKRVFSLDSVFDTKNAAVSAAKSALETAQFQYDELVKSGDKKATAAGAKALEDAKEKFAAAKAELKQFCDTQAAQL